MLKQTLLTIALLTTLTLFAAPVTPVHAQSVGLSISPPVVEILLAPNKKVTQTFTIKNQGESATITPTLHTVTPIDEAGHVTVSPQPVNPASIPLVASLQSHQFGDAIALPAGASLPLTLTFEGASIDTPTDTYLAFVVQASPLSLQSNQTTSTSPAISGLLFITLTPSGVIPANLEITNVDPPLFHDTSSPFTLNPLLKNSAGIMIRPGLELTIVNSQGKTVYQPEAIKSLLLKEGERNFGPLTWNPRWTNLGPHRIRLAAITEGGTKLTEIERLVWFLPIRALIALLVLAVIIVTVIVRQRKGSITTLVVFATLSMLIYPPRASASLTNVSDTLSTSLLSTIEVPIKPRHTITFTPSKVTADGYFRILLPADPDSSNDGIADDEGYDFNSSVPLSINDVTGYTFTEPMAIPAGDPSCTIPTPYHCFEFHYSGSGGTDEPITLTLGNETTSLIAPTATINHREGTADLSAFIVRHYDAEGTMLDYTIGRIGHVEGVKVVARVKGTPQPDRINLINIPFFPATLTEITTRYNQAAIIVSMLALGGIVLIIFLLIRRKNILIIDARTQKAVDHFILYHSLPETRRVGSPIWLAKHEPLSYEATKHNHGRLHVRGLSRYSTLTIRIGDATHILSLSRKQRFYTIPL